MRLNLFILIIVLGISNFVKAQLVETPKDAKKLQENKEQFIGKTFKQLLDSIQPAIKYAYGNPGNNYSYRDATYIKFFFDSKDEEFEKRRNNIKAIGVTINFNVPVGVNNTHKTLPVGGLNVTKEELIREYGDMVVMRIYVSGDN